MKAKIIKRIIWVAVILALDISCGISWYNNGCDAKEIALGVSLYTICIGALWFCVEYWNKKE